MTHPYRTEHFIEVVPTRTRAERYAFAAQRIARAMRRPWLTKRAFERLGRLRVRAEKRARMLPWPWP